MKTSWGSSIHKREQTIFVGLRVLSWDLHMQMSAIVPKPENVLYHKPQPSEVQSQHPIAFTF